MARAVGIDLGTTNSCVAVLEGGEPKVIANAEGSRTTPSIVAFAKNGEVLVGEVAKRQAVTNPDRTVRSVKRKMGTNWTIDIDGKKYTPQEISARVLQKLKRDAESYLGEAISDAVITVPAYFNDSQRTATKAAGEIAGFNVLRIVNEPTAAALAYNMERGPSSEQILIFDLGGGTFDVSLLQVRERQLEVKATSGDNRLGGDDWDQMLIDHLVKDIIGQGGGGVMGNSAAMQRLKEAAEKAKIELSAAQTTSINLPYITDGPSGPLHLDSQLTRTTFQRMTQDLLDRCNVPFESAIRDAKVKVADVDHVILVGGSTRMPAVTNLVKSLTGTEPNKGVNPDEVVAVGAALQAGLLTGETRNIILLDVTSLSLGVAIKNGIFARLIERNSKVPARKSKLFTTIEDNQPSVSVQAYQGEREMAADNMPLGTFELTGLPPVPKGIPQIEVTFDIDVNGIVEVTAKDAATGNAQSMIVTGESGLSKQEIEGMRREATDHLEEDRRKRAGAEARNLAEARLWDAEKFLAKPQGRSPAVVRDEMILAMNGLRAALAGSDAQAISKTSQWLDYLYRSARHADRHQNAKISKPADGRRTPLDLGVDVDTVGWEPGTGLVTTGDLLAGRYMLARPLGNGGYGGVWRANDLQTGSQVAIKVIHAGLLADDWQRQEVLERFQREADALAKVNHPNVVAVLDRGLHDGTPFLVMELVSGRSLAAELKIRLDQRQSGLRLKEVLGIGVEICRGLVAIHQIGLVHRDLKPLNLMLGQAGEVKIVDFGLVRSEDAATITHSHVPIGTPAYMSPEQFIGDPPDARTDLYSLGCCLYELACGHYAFDRRAGIPWAVVHLRQEPVPLRRRLRNAPRGLEQLVSDLLKKNPKERPSTALEVQKQLERLASSH